MTECDVRGPRDDRDEVLGGATRELAPEHPQIAAGARAHVVSLDVAHR